MFDEIDGAKIIKYSHSGNYGLVEWENGKKKEIKILAICNYDNKDEYYLFACDEQLNVLGDTLHDSIEDAMEVARQLYKQDGIEWI